MIRIRLVAADVDELRRAAAAVNQVFTVARQTAPRPRRSGDGYTIYIEATPVSDSPGGVGA